MSGLDTMVKRAGMHARLLRRTSARSRGSWIVSCRSTAHAPSPWTTTRLEGRSATAATPVVVTSWLGRAWPTLVGSLWLPRVRATPDGILVEVMRPPPCELDAVQRRTAKTSRAVVANLKAAGLSGNDTAVVLGVSPQRVSQLNRS